MNKLLLAFFDNKIATDFAQFGGKAASLAIMYQNMQKIGIDVPYGFTTTAGAYRDFIALNNLAPIIKDNIERYRNNPSLENLEQCSKNIRASMEAGTLPPQLEEQFLAALHELHDTNCMQCNPTPADRSSVLRPAQDKRGLEEYGWIPPQYPLENIPQQTCTWSVAIRSSATAEDMPTASFAGQQETFLNIHGDDQALQALKKCISSIYTPRAIVYRDEHSIGQLDVALAAVVMPMVRSDLGAAGVMFTLETESGFDQVVTINANYGLGESIVQGQLQPDSWYVHKQTLQQGYPAILASTVGTKEFYTTFTQHGSETVETPKALRNRFCLAPDHVLQLAQWAIIIEKLYSEQRGSWCPMDIEWALDGISGKLYIVQARPETVHSNKNRHTITTYQLASSGTAITQGISIGQGAVAGSVQRISSAQEINQFKSGNILVTTMTDPDWVPIMKQARAIITTQGGRTCHAAIVSRELGIPALVGVQDALEILQDGQEITLDCSMGTTGYIYEGILPIKQQSIALEKLARPPIPYWLNVGQPDIAFSLVNYPASGVGLARTEFIIANTIGIHPMACLQLEKLDQKIKEQLLYRTASYESPDKFFVATLAQQIATIAAAFHPRPVIVRTSDFKTNEYHNLLGGEFFEPEESNPMLGLRGASRYRNPRYQPAFALECQALAMARDIIGMQNIAVMIPFVRSVQELKDVLVTMAHYKLSRDHGLKLYMMCELPINISQLPQLAGIVDGISIGSNDLTQLMLGVDRDCADVADLYNEQAPGVVQAMLDSINGAHQAGITVGICGQGPSDFPALAQKLIDGGIDYLSLTPDALIRMLS